MCRRVSLYSDMLVVMVIPDSLCSYDKDSGDDDDDIMTVHNSVSMSKQDTESQNETSSYVVVFPVWRRK